MEQVELKFNEMGLIPAIVQDSDTKEVLMMAYMNKESLMLTIRTKKATYWSRSRKKLWVKGETSGHFQEEVEKIYYDCDADTLLLMVQQTGAACHTGSKSCFYRQLTWKGITKVSSKFDVFQEVYDIVVDRKTIRRRLLHKLFIN